MTAKITAETAALLALIRPADGAMTSAHTDQMYAVVEPIHAAVDTVRQRVTDIQRARRTADAVEGADYAYAFFEQIKQTCEALIRELDAAGDHIDRACDTAFQLDQHGVRMQKSLDTHEDRLQGDANAAAQRVTISKDEYDHLLARAQAGSAAVAELSVAKTAKAPTP